MQLCGVEVVQYADRLRLPALLEENRAARPVRVRRRGAMNERRLIHPAAGVRDSGPSTRALPTARIIAGEGPGPVNMPEDHPVGVDLEPLDDLRKRRNAG